MNVELMLESKTEKTRRRVHSQRMRPVSAEVRIPASRSKNHFSSINPEAEFPMHHSLFAALSLSCKVFELLHQAAICTSLCLRHLPAMIQPPRIVYMLQDVHRLKADIFVLRCLS